TSGTVRVYDTKVDAFSLVAEIPLGPSDGTSLINDVIITKTAAYFTDSFIPQLYSVRDGCFPGFLIGRP
ncbi:unnamed protein product, partial [Hapterophycus canaliculatus]